MSTIYAEEFVRFSIYFKPSYRNIASKAKNMKYTLFKHYGKQA